MRRAAERVARRDGHRVSRPLGTGRAFALTYVRRGRRGGTPVLFVPGGPGLASVLPYRRIRGLAAESGLDVLMVEHRGIGLSRRDDHGADLPPDAVTVVDVVDDLAAVLDHARIPRAIVYGSSYGTYLAQGFGVRHPDRVAGMVLDSPMLSVEQDLAMSRAYRRRLFLDGTGAVAEPVAAAVRAALDGDLPTDEVGEIVQLVYEFAGPEVLRALLEARRAGRLRRTWERLVALGRAEADGRSVPYYLEPAPVSGITYRELGVGIAPDGLPLDPQATFAATGPHPPYAGEPFDLPAALGAFGWPTAILSGERDLRTPPPVAARIAQLVPDAVAVSVAGMGHSALDTHRLVAVRVATAMADGAAASLPASAPVFARLPRQGPSNLLGRLIAGAVAVDARLPGGRAPARR